MDALEATKLLHDYGPYAGLVVLGVAYWHERKYSKRLTDKILDNAVESAKTSTAMTEVIRELKSEIRGRAG